MIKGGRVAIGMFFLLFLIAPINAQIPDSVLNTQEGAVYIFSVVDGTIEIYSNESGWLTEDITIPFSSGCGFFVNDEGYIMTASHVIKHDKVDLQLAALDAFIYSIWYDGKYYETWELIDFEDAYYSYFLNKSKKGEAFVYVDEVNYVYYYKENAPRKVQRIVFSDDPKTGFDIAILKIQASGTPFLKFNDNIPGQGTNIYVVGYPDVDIDVEFSNAFGTVIKDPMLREKTYIDNARKAQKVMLEGLKDKGASIHDGYLGACSTADTIDVCRFQGYTTYGLSGGPVVDDRGRYIGMMTWKSGDQRGYFIPFDYLEQAGNQAGVQLVPAASVSEITTIIGLVIVILLIIGIIAFSNKIKNKNDNDAVQPMETKPTQNIISECIGLLDLSYDWSGRFNRRQYAIFFFIGQAILLAILAISWIFIGISIAFLGISLSMDWVGVIYLIWLIIAIPAIIGADIRRFHDLDISGWYCLLYIIPFVKLGVSLYFLFKNGKEAGKTRWG